MFVSYYIPLSFGVCFFKELRVKFHKNMNQRSTVNLGESPSPSLFFLYFRKLRFGLTWPMLVQQSYLVICSSTLDRLGLTDLWCPSHLALTESSPFKCSIIFLEREMTTPHFSVGLFLISLSSERLPYSF